MSATGNRLRASRPDCRRRIAPPVTIPITGIRPAGVTGVRRGFTTRRSNPLCQATRLAGVNFAWTYLGCALVPGAKPRRLSHPGFFNSPEPRESREIHPSPSGRLSAPVTITTVKKGSEMQSHEFTLILSVEEATDDQCNALYEAGCDDGTISTSERVTRIDFCRDAPTLEEAIRSAIGKVNAAALQVARVEIEADAIATQRR